MEVEEQVLRLTRRGKVLRPFCAEAGVKSHGYSRRLQRVLVDFGAETSFEKSAARIQEHYGISVPVSAVRQQTLQHGRSMAAIPDAKGAKSAAQLLAEMDGSMIPVMQPGSGEDGRKGKNLFWREVKLCCARPVGSVQMIYGATLGSAETAGWLWREVAQAAGLKPRTHVHGVGDGAPWIVEKFKDNFGRQGSYLLDFWHVSEYLAAAAPSLVRAGKEKKWLRRQQGRLLNNEVKKILRTLALHQEPENAPEAPVRAACEYLSQRREHLDYAGARRKGLSIGSGEVESGHGHVIQDRLKLSGCWWKETNAQAMIHLRIARANKLWDSHWLTPKN